MKPNITVFSLLCLLTACTTVQLDRLKKLQAANQFEAIIAETPESSCDASSNITETCQQFYAIRGHAYLVLAMREARSGARCPMPTETARANMKNAVHDYALASGAAVGGSVDETHLSENQVLALTCSAPFYRPDKAVEMTREALAKLDVLPPTPARALTASNALLSLAQRTDLPDTDRCQAAHEARMRAIKGLDGQMLATGETAIRLQQTANATNTGTPGLPPNC